MSRLEGRNNPKNMGTEPSSWFCQVHVALEKNGAGDDPDSQFLIWKVPEEFRTNAEHYEPVSWRFGLHHSPEILHTNGIEGFKIQVARALQLTGERWDTFCKGVVQEPKSYWEVVYGQSPHVRSYTIEEILCLLSLDALFLVVYLQKRDRGNRSFSLALQKVMKNPVLGIYLATLRHGFRLLENQIPMELLKRAIGILRTDCNEDVDMAAWEDVQWQGWNIARLSVWWDTFIHPH